MNTPERPVASPCVHVCALDEEDICIGCQRSVAEISQWSRLDNAERRRVLQCCQARAQAKGLML